MSDQIIWINVLPPDGIPRRYAAFSGESLLEVLDRNRTAGIFSDCQGGDNEFTFGPSQVPYDYFSSGVSCGQCQVVISDPFYDKLNKKPSTEIKVLERAASFYSENSRLACCIQVRPELNEMVVVVADNRSADGEFFSGKNGDAF